MSELNAKLEPCPFCGSMDLSIEGHFYVTCDNCDVTGPECAPRAAAIVAWNSRALFAAPVPAKAVEVTEALRELIDGVQEWCDAVGRDTSWDGWDHHYKHYAYNGGLDKARAALAAAPGGMDPATIEACAKVAEGPIYKERYRGREGHNWSADRHPSNSYGNGRMDAAEAIRALAAAPSNAVTEALTFDRDVFGELVRDAWIRWAKTQPNPKPSWLVPYAELSEPDKEADRQIGETMFLWSKIHIDGAAALAAPPRADAVTEAAEVEALTPMSGFLVFIKDMRFTGSWDLPTLDRVIEVGEAIAAQSLALAAAPEGGAVTVALRACRTFVMACRAEAKGRNDNRYQHTSELLKTIDDVLGVQP